MTAPVALGMTPHPINVSLPRGGDFVCEIVSEQDWPDGVAMELRFHTDVTAAPTATWAATISGTSATWDVPAADVETVLDANALIVRLHYIEADGSVLVWGKGRARAV